MRLDEEAHIVVGRSCHDGADHGVCFGPGVCCDDDHSVVLERHLHHYYDEGCERYDDHEPGSVHVFGYGEGDHSNQAASRPGIGR